MCSSDELDDIDIQELLLLCRESAKLKTGSQSAAGTGQWMWRYGRS
jgi:hypothetical protein